MNFAPHRLTAPAKINLYLHVAGRRADGYHLLASLVAFADYGDVLSFHPAPEFCFSVDGPYAAALGPAERDAGLNSANIAVRAAHGLARLAGVSPAVAVTLTKNLPLAAGLGGGSADAAAILRGLCDIWGLDLLALPGLDALMLDLGADVPACMAGVPVAVSGIGDVLTPAQLPRAMPAVLVNPNIACPTGAVFAAFGSSFDAPPGDAPHPGGSIEYADFIQWLSSRRNSLTPAAVQIVPAIADVLAALESQSGCALSRMSGSGATCFGLFERTADAAAATAALAAAGKNWWVRQVLLNP